MNTSTSTHTHLHALNDWCKSTGLLYPWVRFYSDEADWAVSIVAPVRGQHRPLRTLRGFDLEAVCADILPKAQQLFQHEKPALVREAAAARKGDKAAYLRDEREIEAMHHTAEDY